MFFFIFKTQNCFLNKYSFFEFISKYQKDILRCAPPSSHVCDFFVNIRLFIYIWSGRKYYLKVGAFLPWEIIVVSWPVGYEYVSVWCLIKRKQVYYLWLKLFLLPQFFVIATSILYHVSFLMSLKLMLNQQQWASW